MLRVVIKRLQTEDTELHLLSFFGKTGSSHQLPVLVSSMKQRFLMKVVACLSHVSTVLPLLVVLTLSKTDEETF